MGSVIMEETGEISGHLTWEAERIVRLQPKTKSQKVVARMTRLSADPRMSVFVPEFHGIGGDSLKIKNIDGITLTARYSSPLALASVRWDRIGAHFAGECSTVNGKFTGSIGSGVDADDETEFTFAPNSGPNSTLKFSVFPNPPHVGARVEFFDKLQGGASYRVVGETSRQREPTITCSLEGLHFRLPAGLDVSGSVHYGHSLDLLYEVVSKYVRVSSAGMGVNNQVTARIGLPGNLLFLAHKVDGTVGGARVSFGPAALGVLATLEKRVSVRASVAPAPWCEVAAQVDTDRRVLTGATVKHQKWEVSLTGSVAVKEKTHDVQVCVKWNGMAECALQASNGKFANAEVNFVWDDNVK